MSPRPALPLSKLEAISRAAARFDPTVIGIRSGKLETLINGRLTPFLGLHSAMIGGLVLAAEAPDVYADFGFLFFVAAAVFLGTSLLGWLPRKDNTIPLAVAPSACSALLASLSLGRIDLCLLPLLLIFAALWWLLWTRRTSPYQAIMPCFYLPVLAIFVWPGPETLRYLVAAGVYIPSFWIVSLRHGISKNVPLFLGALIFMFFEIRNHVEDQAIALTVIVLFVVAFMVYEAKATTPHQSALRHFLAQGLAAAVLLIAVFLIDPPGALGAYLTLWTGFLLVYHLAVGGFLTRVSPGTRAAWIGLALTLALWTSADLDQLPTGEFGAILAGNLVSLVVLVLLMRGLASAFGVAFCRVLGFGTMAAVFFQIWTIDDFVSQSDDGFTTLRETQFFAHHGVALLAMAAAIIATYLVSSFLARPVELKPGYPLWQGLIRPRHAVLIRRFVRAVVTQVRLTPILSNLVLGFTTIIGSWSYFKGSRERFTLADLMVLSLHVFAAMATYYLIKPAFLLLGAETPLLAIGLAPDGVAFMAAWSLWSVVIYLRGLITDVLLLRFLGTIFALVPALRYGFMGALPEGLELACLLIASGLPLLLFGLLRRRPGETEEIA